MRRDVFSRQVKDALGSLYDLTHLQNHPLAETLVPSLEMGQIKGECLRELLWNTIDLVRPEPEIPQTRPEWLNYRLLWLRYVQAMTVEDTCDELGLSRRAFYRRHSEALEAVASILWEQHVVRKEAEPALVPTAKLRSSDEPGSREAAQLAQQSPRRPVDIGDTLQTAKQTISAYATQKGVQLGIECDPGLSPVYGDSAMFHQLFLNILTAGLNTVAGSLLYLTVYQREEEIHCELKGLGRESAHECMTADEVSISRDLLQVYGGRLWMESTPDPTLCFTIPCAKPASLLIVDDDLEAIELYKRYVEDRGWQAHSARSADEVWAHMGTLKPSVILLDILMPQEDGWELLQRLKARLETQDIPVVICSVLKQPELALSLGASDVLQKPITQERLVAAIQKLLPER